MLKRKVRTLFYVFLLIAVTAWYVMLPDDGLVAKPMIRTDVSSKSSSSKYYQSLATVCRSHDGVSCCMSSLSRMRANGYLLMKNNACPEQHQMNTLKCMGSYRWCEPKS